MPASVNSAHQELPDTWLLLWIETPNAGQIWCGLKTTISIVTLVRLQITLRDEICLCLRQNKILKVWAMKGKCRATHFSVQNLSFLSSKTHQKYRASNHKSGFSVFPVWLYLPHTSYYVGGEEHFVEPVIYFPQQSPQFKVYLLLTLHCWFPCVKLQKWLKTPLTDTVSAQSKTKELDKKQLHSH